jgi:hypothetical protein
MGRTGLCGGRIPAASRLGYIHEYPIARVFLDARVHLIYCGTNEIMGVPLLGLPQTLPYPLIRRVGRQPIERNSIPYRHGCRDPAVSRERSRADPIDPAFATVSYENSSGVSISGPLGIDLSARTGYSSTAKIIFSFTKKKRLCGTNADPGDNARRLVSR